MPTAHETLAVQRAERFLRKAFQLDDEDGYEVYINLWGEGPWGLRVASYGASNGSQGFDVMRIEDSGFSITALEDLIIAYAYFPEQEEIDRLEALITWLHRLQGETQQ